VNAAISFWVGVGFAGVLVAFLVYSFVTIPKQTVSQAKTTRFLSALCAGAAAVFISGSAVFDATWTTTGGKVAISGTAGVALFFAVFFFYDKVFVPDDAVEFDLPNGCSFRHAADAAAQISNVTIDYRGFNQSELDSPMSEGHLSCETLAELFAMLRLKTKNVGSVREYTITNNGGIYRLEIK
jgi:hypothetical protein